MKWEIERTAVGQKSIEIFVSIIPLGSLDGAAKNCKAELQRF